MGREKFREGRLLMEQTYHRRLIQASDRAVRDGRGRRDAERLTGETSFPKKIAAPQNRYHCFLAFGRQGGDFDLALLKEEQRIGGVALREDDVPLRKFQRAPPVPDAGQERFRIERAVDLRCHPALLACSSCT